MAEIRRQEFTCTLVELAANPNKVLAMNEFLYVRQTDGKLKMMAGDGVTKISLLPYSIDIGAITQAVVDANAAKTDAETAKTEAETARDAAATSATNAAGAVAVAVNAFDATIVHKATDETVTGVKTFSASPIVPAPTTDMQPTTKKYVDDKDAVIRVKAEENTSAIKGIEETLININPAAETRLTQTSYDRIVSLPKNAGEGGLKSVIGGNTLKNETTYNRTTWAEWTKTASVVGDGTGLTLTATTPWETATRLTAFKPSTKYGILYDVVATTLISDVFKIFGGGAGHSFPTLWIAPRTVGKQKVINTTNSIVAISFNNDLLICLTSSTITDSIKIKDIRIFELPTGSQIETDFTNLTADQLAVRYPYIDGTQSVIAPRIKSVNADLSKTSYLYSEPKTLCRVPNGVRDTIENGNYVQRMKEYTLQTSDIMLFTTSYINFDNIFIVLPSDCVLRVPGENSGAISTKFSTPAFVDYGLDSATLIGKHMYSLNTGATNYLMTYCFAKGSYANLAAVQAFLVGKKIIYQLAVPIVTENVTSGAPLSYPSGSIYLEPALADAGVYSNKMSILLTAFPIQTLESIYKVNSVTGEQTPLNVSTAVIAGDKLSFTHPSLISGDIVFFIYFYAETGCYGSNTFSYYDSRYVIQDSVITAKYYKWKIAIANGVATTVLTEVV